jgi:tetratricopeptide (TPR) repeat protein
MPTVDDRFIDFYELIGVPVNASPDVIRQAVKDKRRKTNPQQNHPDPMRRALAEQIMRDLDAAERILLDVRQRGPYDAERPTRLAASAAAATSGMPTTDDWADRVQYFLDNENPAAAHRVAIEAVTHAPGDPRAWTLRGQSSALLGNFPDAEYELSEASRLDQTVAFPFYLLGEVYSAQEKWKSALTQYDRALSMEPDNPVFGTSKARLFIENDRADLAVSIMEPIVRRYPGDDVYTYHLAMAYYEVAINAAPTSRSASRSAASAYR